MSLTDLPDAPEDLRLAIDAANKAMDEALHRYNLAKAKYDTLRDFQKRLCRHFDCTVFRDQYGSYSICKDCGAKLPELKRF